MTLINNIKALLVGKSNLPPSGFCPNCWGRQEYGGNFYEAVKNEGIDLNNIDQKKGWIQDYVNKNLSSIALQNRGTSKTCNVCYTSFNHEQ